MTPIIERMAKAMRFRDEACITREDKLRLAEAALRAAVELTDEECKSIESAYNRRYEDMADMFKAMFAALLPAPVDPRIEIVNTWARSDNDDAADLLARLDARKEKA